MLLEQITLRNLLSFKDATVDLGPLNILIGENTAGKTNLIEAISLLQATPGDFRTAILRGGGIRFWLWLGGEVPSPIATLACRAHYDTESAPAHYTMEFFEDVGGMAILSEVVSGDSGELYLTRTNQSVTQGAESGHQVESTRSVFSLIKSPFDPTPVYPVSAVSSKGFASIGSFKRVPAPAAGRV